MAKMPIEIIDLREHTTKDLWEAVALSNRIQNSFLFSGIEGALQLELKLLCFRTINTTGFFDSFEEKRQSFRGFHPFTITFVDSELESEEWKDLFSSSRSSKGIAVSTTNQVEGIIIPKGKMVAYFLYELARHTLSFVVPDHHNHKDTRSCVYDFKEYKEDLLLSMKSGALCDDCRRALIEVGKNMSGDQFEALDTIFAESGRVIKKEDVKPTESKLRVFIGSSVEGLDVARRIQSELSHDFSVEIWNQDTVFGLGRATIEALEQAVQQYAFGIFVFSPDDQLLTRGENRAVARDNVLFESGLFIGKLTRLRAFIVHPGDGSVTLPSDLNGMTTATYDSDTPNPTAALGPACQKIRLAINEVCV